MNKQINESRFNDFFKCIETAFVKYLFSNYDINYLKLNAYMLQKDAKSIDKQFEMLLTAKKTGRQREDILRRSFYYYVQINNTEKCRSLIDNAKTVFTGNELDNMLLLYDVLIEKQSNHIDELEAKIENQNGIKLYSIYTLLSKQYSYLNDKENEEKYAKLAIKKIEELKTK